MGVPISNASDRTLTQNTGTLPDMSDALLNYFQPMTFTVIVKTIVNFQLVQTPTDVTFQGVWQPFTEQQLQMMEIGQRLWPWFWVHSDPSLVLNPDDVVVYQSVQYRVMGVKDYTLYGYREYKLVKDYTGSGP